MAKINVRDRNKGFPDKKPNWEYRFEAAKIDGKRKHLSKAGFKTKKEALVAGTKALAEYNNGGLCFEPSDISVSDYLDYWFEQNCKINLKYNTQLSYAGLIKNHFKPYFGHYKLKSLSPSIIQEYVNTVGLSGYSHSMLVNLLATLQSALDYAVHPLCYIKDNPTRYVKFPTGGKKRKEHIILTQDEFEKIIERFPFGNRFHIPLLIGWCCGLRISETFGLTWDDIDFEKKTLSVNKQILKRKYGEFSELSPAKKFLKEDRFNWYFVDPKYESSRIIKIGDTLLNELIKEKKRQEDNEREYGEYYTVHYLKMETDEKNNPIRRIIPASITLSVALPRVNMLCIDENGTYTSVDSFKYPSRVIHRELKIAFDYHSLRHTHATRLIESGVSPKAVQQRLGHKSIITTLQTYVHTTEAMQDEAVEKFEQTIKPKTQTETIQNE